jgi:hypothetical protein
VKIIQSCIQEKDGKYTLEITIAVNDTTTIGPLSAPITEAEATALKLAGVPSCS